MEIYVRNSAITHTHGGGIMPIRKLTEDELAWKIIRASNKKYYLVEATIPAGAKLCSYTRSKSPKIRVDKAIINYITEVEDTDRLNTLGHVRLWDAIAGCVPTKFTLFEKRTMDKVRHHSEVMSGVKLTYTVGKTVKPSSFSKLDMVCTSGLHFYTEASLTKKIKWSKR